MKKKIKIPFDVKSSIKIKNWPSNYKPLVCERAIDKLFNQQNAALSRYISILPDSKKKDVFLLSLLDLKKEINYYIVAIFAINKANILDVSLESTTPEVNYLLTGDEAFLKKERSKILSENISNFSFFRRIVRTITWSRPSNILKTFFFPEIIAVGYNTTSIQYIKETKKSVYFYQAAVMLKKARLKNFGKGNSSYIKEISQDFYHLFMAGLKIEGEYKDRFKLLLRRKINKHVADCCNDLHSCYLYPKLPKNIWIGTGESYNNRLLAISTRRMGGKVTGFAHAIGGALTASYHRLYQGEFAVVDNFIEISDYAKNVYFPDILNFFPSLKDSVKIHALNKNLKYSFFHDKTTNLLKNKPVVMYLSTMTHSLSRGEVFSENMQYVDWQMRLTNMLEKMEIDLVCQPHPEGAYAENNLTHPLLKKHQKEKLKFEDNFHNVDVFLFDFLYCTPAGYMLTSDKPIVRLSILDDSTAYGVNKNIEPQLNNRCRTVRVNFADDCKPCVDFKDLEYALTNNWQEKINSSEFKNIFHGEN